MFQRAGLYTMSPMRRLLIALATATTAAGLLVGCSSKDAGGPLPEATTLVKESATTTANLKSAHLALSVTGQIKNLPVKTLEGDLTTQPTTAAKGSATITMLGSDLDAKTQAQIERGKRIVEVFKQPQYNPIPVEVQVAVLWTVQNGYMDDIAVEKIKDFQEKLTDYLTSRKADLMAQIAKEKALSDALTGQLKTAVSEFKQTYR